MDYKNQIHYELQSFHEINNPLFDKVKDKIDFIYIDPIYTKLSKKQGQLIREKCNNGLKLIVKDDIEFAIQCKADGLLFATEKKDISSIKNKFPDWIIGGQAHSLVDCKNWELKKIDFIVLSPPKRTSQKEVTSILGSELAINSIPKEEEYGWMILSINTPIIISAIFSFTELRETLKMTSMNGIHLTTDFESTIDLDKTIQEIQSIFSPK